MIGFSIEEFGREDTGIIYCAVVLVSTMAMVRLVEEICQRDEDLFTLAICLPQLHSMTMQIRVGLVGPRLNAKN